MVFHYFFQENEAVENFGQNHLPTVPSLNQAQESPTRKSQIPYRKKLDTKKLGPQPRVPACGIENPS